MAWVLDYEEDIESDLSVFHRVDDPMTLSGPSYFARAERLPAYEGVMRRRAQAEADRNGGVSVTPGRVQVDDTTSIQRLETEGWLEHNVEAGTE